MINGQANYRHSPTEIYTMKHLLLAASLLALTATPPFARDQIRIVGSSTVYPFSTTVAEQFVRSTGMKAPIVESTGTGGGVKLFCSGVGEDTPDFVNASRKMKRAEFEICKKNGVDEVVEFKLGYDGLTISSAVSAPDVSLTRKQIFQALAKQVPDKDGKLVDNPYKKWSDIDPALPAENIEVLGPPPTSGTRDSFAELFLKKGAQEFESLTALESSDAAAFEAVWKAVRTDGAYVEAGENDNLIIQKLSANPKGFGIFGFSFLDQNRDKMKAVAIEGDKPEYDSIANGNYKGSRLLYIYMKKAHLGLVPGMIEFVTEFTSKTAIGEDGYLLDKGLVGLKTCDAEWSAGTVDTLPLVDIDFLK
jgi:phosphate transport system substrate-binding protein